MAGQDEGERVAIFLCHESGVINDHAFSKMTRHGYEAATHEAKAEAPEFYSERNRSQAPSTTQYTM